PAGCIWWAWSISARVVKNPSRRYAENGAEKERGTDPMTSLSNVVHRRDSSLLILFEFTILAALFVADVYHHIFFSKVPYLLLLGWASLRLRGMRWKDVGFARPPSWGITIAVGVFSGIFIEVFELFVSQPLLVRWMGKMPDLSNF